MHFSSFTEPKIQFDNPSPPIDIEGPFDEFEFKPILNPPPEFYDLKPVQVNPFHNDDIGKNFLMFSKFYVHLKIGISSM